VFYKDYRFVGSAKIYVWLCILCIRALSSLIGTIYGEPDDSTTTGEKQNFDSTIIPAAGRHGSMWLPPGVSEILDSCLRRDDTNFFGDLSLPTVCKKHNHLSDAENQEAVLIELSPLFSLPC
jgi:hypothetical protein